jgi:ABC-type hemin transport system ATPase subunit
VFKKINVKEFATVPYLETSNLMQTHPEGLQFSTEKPNAIVGPNGAGKSALLKALALHTLSWFTGTSAFDSNYLDSFKLKDAWREADAKRRYAHYEATGRWEDLHDYLGGFEVETDYAPALYYRPGHIPGNERMVSAAMMAGYCEEAKAYGRMTEKKSSGQQCLALLERVHAVLGGDTSSLKGFIEQNGGLGNGVKSRHLTEPRTNLPVDAKPVLLMDEPEQSLDAHAELVLWHQIAAADMSKMQVIVATHSLYPLMHPEKFNIIEAVPGYSQSVTQLL